MPTHAGPWTTRRSPAGSTPAELRLDEYLAVPENSLLRQRGAVSAPTDFSAPTPLPGKLRCGM